MNTTALSPTPTIIYPAQVLAAICKELGCEVPSNGMFLEKVRIRNRDLIISAPENAIQLIKKYLHINGVIIETLNEHSIRVPFV